MTYEDADAIYQKAFSCDYYLMSTNGVTIDGELFNIDGRGNRVSALIYGPKQVFILCGMNKVAPSLEACIERVRNTAADGPRTAVTEAIHLWKGAAKVSKNFQTEKYSGKNLQFFCRFAYACECIPVYKSIKVFCFWSGYS